MPSKRGLAILMDAGMGKKPADDEEEDKGDDETEVDEGEKAAAEDLCRALGVPEDNADDVARALARFCELKMGG